MGTDEDPIDMDFGGFKFSLARIQLAAKTSTKGWTRGKKSDKASLAEALTQEKEQSEDDEGEEKPVFKGKRWAERLKSLRSSS